MDKSMTSDEDFRALLIKHYRDKYIKALDLDAIEDKRLGNYLKKLSATNWSHKIRIIDNIQVLKHTFTFNKSDMITTCFKITLDSTSSIYAYLHSKCVSGRGGPKIEHMYVCTGPTYRSQDGEYRSRVIPWSQYNALFVKYADIFGEVEVAVVSRLESRVTTYQTDFYYPASCTGNKRAFEDSINSLRLPIKFYILCWIVDFYEIHGKIIANHVNPAYRWIMYQPEDIPLFESIVKKMGRNDYLNMKNRIEHYFSDLDVGRQSRMPVGCGQKIFPLTAMESARTGDINFNVWREIYITELLSNLVLNLISPSFPFINNWFYIQNAHAGLYDNMAMHTKYLQSEIAAEVAVQLKITDKLNYEKTESGEQSKEPLSGKFFRLSKNIHKSIVYADKDIKLTDLAVCMTTEYVGRTLRDIPALIVSKDRTPGLEQSFTDAGIFNKHMFEFIYSFYCMNSISGVYHGDLHMNNATIYKLYEILNTDNTPVIDNPYAAYVVGQEAYVFPHYGLFSMIIDSSRAIIGDYERLEHEFSPLFAELYFKEQLNRVLHNIHHYFPYLIKKYRERIESLLINNFPLMFKILSATDTFVIMSNIEAMFSVDDSFTKGAIKIAPGAIALLKKLAAHAESLVATHVQSAIEGRISMPDDIEWPNLQILQKHFKSYLLTPEKMADKNINVIEIFNSNNSVISEIEDYDTWGPLLSLDNEIELMKKHNRPMYKDLNDWLVYKHYDESDAVEALTSKYEDAEIDILEMENWMVL